MALQIANPTVVKKIEALSKITGLTKTASVEKAVDRLLAEEKFSGAGTMRERFDAILAQFDRLPEIGGSVDPLEWDEFGLPR